MKQFSHLTIVFSYFPQIYRKIAAKPLKIGLKLTVFGLLAAFLLINLLPNLPADFLSFERAKLAVMVNPNDVSSHFLLTQEYLKRGDMEAVKRELIIAQNLTNPSPLNPNPSSDSVLGASLSPAKILEKIQNEPERIKREIAFWEKVITNKPDYRDAYLQLTILNFQIYEKEKAREYLKKAKELDPNFEATQQLKTIIK